MLQIIYIMIMHKDPHQDWKISHKKQYKLATPALMSQQFEHRKESEGGETYS